MIKIFFFCIFCKNIRCIYINKHTSNAVDFSLPKRLTVEGQVSKEGSQQVHDEHGQEGHIGNALHLFAGTAVWAEECLI